MDKRYFVIILIIIFCSINLYYITDISDVVGTASVTVNGYTISIPENFNLLNTYEKSVLINNPNSNLFIAIHPLGNKEYDFNKILLNYQNNTKIKIISSGTININNITVDTIYYENYEDAKNPRNCSIFYFKKNDATFRIEMAGFDYNTERDETINILTFIINSIKKDLKR